MIQKGGISKGHRSHTKEPTQDKQSLDWVSKYKKQFAKYTGLIAYTKARNPKMAWYKKSYM